MLNLPPCLNKFQGTSIAPVFSILLLCSALHGCGGGGGGNNSNTVDNQPTYNSSGQALLGPVVEASVDLYTLDSTTAPVCTTITTDSDVLEDAGLIQFEDECLTTAGPYIVVVSGGSDIDADDDGVRDTAPTAMNGALHALMTAEQIRGQDWKVNILTDVIYSRVRYMLAVGMEQEEVLANLAPLSIELLREDINGDGNIDYRDALAWSPRRNDIRLKISADEATALTASIHAGTSREYLALNQPGRRGTVYPIETYTPAFSIVEERAYLCGNDALELVDISHPNDISRIAYYPDLPTLDSSGIGLQACEATSDGYLYYFEVIGDSIGILEIGASGTITETRFARRAASAVLDTHLIENRLYVITYTPQFLDQGYLEIYGIENRLEPRLLSTVEFNGVPLDIEVGPGGLLYLPTSNGELVLLDVTDSASPDIVGRYEFSGNRASVAVRGDRAYLSIATAVGNTPPSQGELLTLDIGNPNDIKRIGEGLLLNSWPGSLQISGSSLLSVQLDEKDAYRIVQFNLSNPDNPGFTGALADSGTARLTTDFQLQSGILFMVDSGRNFHSLPLPTIDPGLLGIEPTRGRAYALTIKDEVAYLPVRGVGLYVIDVADPTNPETINLLDGEDEKNAGLVAINGDRALLLGQMNPPGTRLMDISNPFSIAQIGNIDMGDQFGNRAEGAAIKDNIAYLASDVLGLIVADISDPSHPQVLTRFPLPEGRGEYSGIGIAGDYLLALDEGSGMDIIDVSNPSQPVRVGSYTSTLGEPDNIWTPANVEVAGGFAYITQVDFLFHGNNVEVIGGLEIVDISNPLAPTFVSTLNTSGKSLSVALSDNVAYVRDTAGAIDIVDITDPVQPKLQHSVRVPDTLGAIAVDEKRIYVSGSDGMYIYKRPLFEGLP